MRLYNPIKLQSNWAMIIPMRVSLTAQPATQVGAENAISRASRELRSRAAPWRGVSNSQATNNLFFYELLTCESLRIAPL